jgi:uncharacterized membrane protein YjdF
MRKIKNFEWAILLFNIIYLIIFTLLYLKRANYEFLLYIGVVSFFLILISFLHLKYRFSKLILIGMSLWGLLHMSGGYFIVGNGVLYNHWIFPFLRFDQFVHAVGFGFATLLSYHILKPSLNKNYSKIIISVLIVLIGMGIGAFNEIVEFISVLTMVQTGVGGYDNTMWDIVFNTIGAILAVSYLRIKKEI